MNILEQEDMVKGLPDDILIQQAQNPSNQLPQFLVVSEIQRREKMRKSYAEAVPEESIKDQVISSGLASMSPELDPLMASAMGAQGGQDPMQQQMQPPMQQPMQQMQQPMQQQMQPPMQDPMMQQQMMAAGGGMMPYRMFNGRDVPFSDLEALIDQLINQGVPPEQAEVLAASEYGDEYNFKEETDALLGRGVLDNINKGGVGEAVNLDVGKGDKVDSATAEVILAGADGPKVNSNALDYMARKYGGVDDKGRGKELSDLGEQGFVMPTLETLSQGMGGLSYTPEAVDYGSAIEKVNAARDASLLALDKNKPDFLSAYDDVKNKPNLDFSGFGLDYKTLIADAEKRATGIRDDAKKDSGYQALIALGAGISEGKLGQGIRDAGTRMTDIRSQARKEASAESQLARRMELAGEESKMNLGIKGQEAGNVEATNRRGAVTSQYKAERESELAKAGIIDKSARDQINLEVKSLEADYSRNKDEYDANIEKFVKQGALLRYRDLENQSQRSLDRSILTAISGPIEDAFKEWNLENPSKSAEEKATYLRSLIGQFITLDEINKYSNNSNSPTDMRIVR